MAERDPGRSSRPGYAGILDPASPRRPSAPGRPEPALAACGRAELRNLLERRRLHAHDHELGYAVADRHVEGDVGIGVEQQHAQLAAIAGVDQARCGWE